MLCSFRIQRCKPTILAQRRNVNDTKVAVGWHRPVARQCSLQTRPPKALLRREKPERLRWLSQGMRQNYIASTWPASNVSSTVRRAPGTLHRRTRQ